MHSTFRFPGIRRTHLLRDFRRDGGGDHLGLARGQVQRLPEIADVAGVADV